MQIQEVMKGISLTKNKAVLIPTWDQYKREHVPDNINLFFYLTNFKCSNGILFLFAKKIILFTDSRYYDAAKIHNFDEVFLLKDFKKVIINLDIKSLVFDGCLFTFDYFKSFDLELCCIDSISEYLGVDFEPKINKTSIYIYQYSELSSEEKCKKYSKEKPWLILDHETISWLLNIRCLESDSEDLSVTSKAILYNDGTIDLYLDDHFICDEITDVYSHVTIKKSDELEDILKSNIDIYINKDISYQLYNVLVLSGHEGSMVENHCLLPKACKDFIEREGAIDAHIRDGVAITKMLHWLFEDALYFSEKDIADQLLSIRKEDNKFTTNSFATISALGKNSTYIHYNSYSTNKVNHEFNDILLLDMGGHYIAGTTDVSRTFIIGEPSEDHRKHYTLVLKGHIALASVIFPKDQGVTGKQLDILARQYLWGNGLDYKHGTGHGVGSCLSV
ncbi:MAG: M24 family metallopeptidase, partial [Anaplasmataceae bacterium]|nr:M24 family metallopeptidase [Anaplasmataceae bacterium]